MKVFVLILTALLSLQAFSFRPLAALGGVELVELGVYGDRPEAYLGDRPLRLERAEDGQWVAVVGLDLSLDTKQAQAVRMVDSAGRSILIAFRVADRDYPAQYITLDESRYVRPDKKALERIAKEREQLRSTYEHFSDALIAPLAFRQPVSGRISGAFGVRRFFNGEPRSRHHGLDIAAARHSPIGAPQAGEVLMTGDLFFCGQMVLLDHGQGLLSLYCHLEEVRVKPAQRVSQSEVIGTVGSSGRATGPHLHWGVRLNGVWVDPALLIGR